MRMVRVGKFKVDLADPKQFAATKSTDTNDDAESSSNQLHREAGLHKLVKAIDKQ
jgi:hypothetical protein